MTTTFDAVVASAQFRPVLRSDVRFLTGSKPDTVIVHDKQSNSRIEIYAFEGQIAKAMDGTRNLAALAQVAASTFGEVPERQVAKVVAQIAGMGLIANIGELRHHKAPLLAPMGASTIPPLKVVPRASKAQSIATPPGDETGEQGLEFGDNTAMRALEAIGGDSSGAWEPQTAPTYSSDQNSPEALADTEASSTGEPEAPRAHVEEYEDDVSENDEPEEDDVSENDSEEEEEEAWASDEEAQLQRERRKRNLRRAFKYGTIGVFLMAFAFFPWPLYVTEQCIVRPLDRVEVRSVVPGIVIETFVNEGDFVEEGQLLARLDDRNIKYQLARAEAELVGLRANLEKLNAGSRPEEIRQAKARVTAAQQDRSIAKRRFERAKKLFRSGVGSRGAFDEARGELAVRTQEVAEAKAAHSLVNAGFRSEEIKIGTAELRRAEVDVAHYKEQLELLQIRAPQSGRVLTPRFHERLHRKIEAGAPLIEIGDATQMRVEINVPEKYADVLSVGQPVEVKVHSFPLRSFHGEVVSIAAAVDAKAGTLRVDVNVDNSDGALQPRMTGWGEINAGTSTPLIRVFRSAARWVRVRYLL